MHAIFHTRTRNQSDSWPFPPVGKKTPRISFPFLPFLEPFLKDVAASQTSTDLFVIYQLSDRSSIPKCPTPLAFLPAQTPLLPPLEDLALVVGARRFFLAVVHEAVARDLVAGVLPAKNH